MDARIYVNGREIIDDSDEPHTLESAARAVVSLLTGSEPGTTGRIEQGSATVRRWTVEADGRAVETTVPESEQILALRRRAVQNGDGRRVTICDLALDGNATARGECARALAAR